MEISDNILAKFQQGLASPDEDLMVLNEIAENKEFCDMMDIFDEINSWDNIDELSHEFHESIDNAEKFQDLKSKIK
jgi:hypothetical protein